MQLGERRGEVCTGRADLRGALHRLGAHILIRQSLQAACRRLKSREHPHAIVARLCLFDDLARFPSGLQDEHGHESGQYETGDRRRRKLPAQARERCCEHAALRPGPTLRLSAGNCFVAVHRAFIVRSFRRQRLYMFCARASQHCLALRRPAVPRGNQQQTVATGLITGS